MAISRLPARPVAGQKTAMVMHQQYPLNVGAPPALARQAFVTPSHRFFVRNHGSVPDVNIESYRLSVSGQVQNRLALSLEELQTSFPHSSITATLQCAGHRRAELAALRPIAGEIQWGADAIGNAVWRGVTLREVLRAAGVEPGAGHVAFLGLDTIDRDGQSFGFGGSIPLEKALSSETLLAYEMNGEPLPPLHGYPLRVIVPGYIGARSVKWLAQIIVQPRPSSNYFQAHAYRLFPPHIQSEQEAQSNPGEGCMLGELPLNSVICTPREDETLNTGELLVQGYALTGTGRAIEHVELSHDGGTSWIEAKLDDEAQQWAWRFWEARLPLLRPGAYELVVRAWDSSGRTQLANPAQLWNYKGYMNSAWHRVHITLI